MHKCDKKIWTAELYEKTFLRQNIEVDKARLKLMQNVASAAISGGYGRLTICRDKEGEAIAACVFMYDDRQVTKDGKS